MQRVIIVNDHGFVNGGQAKVAIDSAVALARRGLDITYFCASGPVDNRLGEAGVSVVCLQQRDILNDPNRLRAAVNGLWNLQSSQALAGLVDASDPRHSIVHCHGFAKALSPSIGPVLTSKRVAHVYTMHEYFLACPNGGFFDYQAGKICKLEPMGPGCLVRNCDARHFSHKVWRMTRQLCLSRLGGLPAKLQHVIYISELQRSVMQAYLPESAVMHYVPNPVDISRQPRARAENNHQFTFIGRFAPEKGAANFARAARQAGVPAVFVGEGPERDVILRENPDARITGWLEADEVQKLISESRCLVFPSLWYECAPLVVMEALASGVPVICGHWSAAAEMVTRLSGGVLLKDDSDEQLVTAMRQISEQVAAFSRQCHTAYWQQPQSLSDHADRLLESYDRILSSIPLRSLSP